MPKRDLSKQLGEQQRYTTQQKVEVQDPIAAATAALQQPLQNSKQADVQEGTQEGIQEDTPVITPTRTHARTHESKQARKHSQIYGKGMNIDMLYDQIQQRKHLSNGSFRYREQELEDMDAIFKELQEKKPGRISKNDIARMALVTLCQDYKENGEESVLAQVFARM